MNHTVIANHPGSTRDQCHGEAVIVRAKAVRRTMVRAATCRLAAPCPRTNQSVGPEERPSWQHLWPAGAFGTRAKLA